MKANRIAYWLIFSAFIGCFLFIYEAMPMIQDDWIYLSESIYDAADQDGHHNMWNGLKNALNVHYNYDISRSGNTIGAAALLFLPLWLTKLIIWACFAWGFYLMNKVCRIKTDNPAGLTALCFFTLLFVNWGEHLFTVMYAFNYIVELPLYFWLFHVLINKKGEISIGAAIICGIALGSWHESYALSFIASAVLLMIIRKDVRTRGMYALTVSTLVGMVWLVLWPGYWIRVNDAEFRLEGIKRLIHVFPWFVTLFVCLGVHFTKRGKGLYRSGIMISTIAGGMVLIPIMVKSTYIRSMTPVFFLSACAISYLLLRTWPRMFTVKTVKGKILCSVALIAIFGHLIAVGQETVILHKTVDGIIARINSNKNGDEMFAPMRYPWQSNPLTLNRPDPQALVAGWTDFVPLKHYLNRHTFKLIIPEELKEYTSEQGIPLGGDSNYKIYKGYIISEDPTDTVNYWVRIDYPNFSEYNAAIRTPFTGADGKKYVYISAMRSLKTIFTGEPQAVWADTTRIYYF